MAPKTFAALAQVAASIVFLLLPLFDITVWEIAVGCASYLLFIAFILFLIPEEN